MQGAAKRFSAFTNNFLICSTLFLGCGAPQNSVSNFSSIAISSRNSTEAKVVEICAQANTLIAQNSLASLTEITLGRHHSLVAHLLQNFKVF
jgi:hypothetical protein